MAQIAASIREWGWTVTVLVNKQGTLIAGHGRVLAAHQLDACINRDVDHGGLVDHQQVAFEWVVAAAFEPAALGIHFASRRRSQLFGYGQSTIGRGAPTNGSGAPSLLVPRQAGDRSIRLQGARAITPPFAASTAIAWACLRYARTCRRNTTASRSTQC